MSEFVYVTYIRTTPAKQWEALTDPDFNRRYWFGIHCESDYKPGASWTMVASDGTITDAGEVLEAEPGKRLVITWRHEMRPELKAEGYTRCSFDIAADGDTTKLTIIHQIDRDGAKVIEAVSGGWPMILSSLKSLLETGTALEITSGRH